MFSARSLLRLCSCSSSFGCFAASLSLHRSSPRGGLTPLCCSPPHGPAPSSAGGSCGSKAGGTLGGGRETSSLKQSEIYFSSSASLRVRVRVTVNDRVRVRLNVD